MINQKDNRRIRIVYLVLLYMYMYMSFLCWLMVYFVVPVGLICKRCVEINKICTLDLGGGEEVT